MDAKTLLEQFREEKISPQAFHESVNCLSANEKRKFQVLAREKLRQSLKDGSLMRRVYDAARPVLERHDMIMRYDGQSGRYRV